MLTIRSRAALVPDALRQSLDGLLWGTGVALDALENLFIDHLFRTRTWSKPTDIYIHLMTSAPTDAGGGTEVTGGSYAPVDLPPLDANWTATQGGTSGNSTGTSGMTSNAVAITFPAPTADWGTVTHYKITDNAGNQLAADALVAPRTILNGDPQPSFAPGSFQISIG